ncbi:von Willebrand factor A domain-containing protein 5A [Marasmius tenuissimus]|uniref:von Willebrand factor A domain-containing protein 5A n=1 Tax=Marasmius tenuissimus TaxID=585030 RepID=A0ABR3AA38_9AGAR
MRYPPICRLYCPRQPSTSFALDSCAVTVLIADVHASVQLSQKFRNPDTTNALEATYTFGLCADAAVCGFEMVREDGTKVEGVVKEKAEAKKEYDDAVKQGYTASLGSEETKDGNISPAEVVTINLRYLQTLKDDEKKDQVRFTFPRTYAQRYGHAPTTDAQKFGTVQQPFTLDAAVQQSGTIKSVSCPSGHPMELELGKPEGFVVEGSADDSQFAKVSLRDSLGHLTQDVIIVVTATGLDNPRCFVESHPSPNVDTLAMGLTLVPRFKIPDYKSGMEYIFLVDRSGSMEGTNIRLVREALVVLLRGLPTKNTTFNVFSFGSKNSKLWDRSQDYTQTNLDAATQHVDSMEANYGGTEIASALQFVYSSLSKPLSRPVSVFLLTDGSAWDVPTCVSHTRSALSDLATDDNFIRVFTVGMGSGASTDTCDSIAKAGNGFSVYVADNEPMVGKCARLVRAARSPPIRDLEVLWTGAETVEAEAGDDFEMVEDDATTLTDAKDTATTESSKAAVSLFDDADGDDKDDVGPPPKPDVTLPPPPRIQQAPLQITNFFPGTRSQMYAIISNKQTSIPSTIKIKGVVTATGAPVELDVPVAQMAKSQQHNHPFLHALAAKALITDRENKIHAFPESVSASFAKNDALRDSYIEKDIVRLGTTYGLTSKHTSFVAIDRRTNKLNPTPPVSETRSSPTGGFMARSAGAPRAMMMMASALPNAPSSPGRERERERMRSSAAPSATATSGAGPPVEPLQNFFQSLLPSSRSSGPSTSGSRLLSSAPGQAHDLVSDSSGDARGGAISFSKKKSRASALPALAQLSARLAPRRDAPPSPTKDAESMSDGARLAAIARLQQFDGGFDFSEDLLRLLQTKVSEADFKQECRENNIEEGVAATVLALVWLEKKGGDESLDLQEKASEWLADRLDEVDTVKQKVLSLFEFEVMENVL